MLSKAAQYAIKALIHISANREEGSRATLSNVAKAIDSPPAFTSKILQQLVAANIITSTKGGGGGYEISEEKIRTTKVITILEAIECADISINCFLGLPLCSDLNPCAVHHIYSPIRHQMNTIIT
jgi:Rrf2 family iron-sulfur cluster assembly transcriptional regulator